ncbi:hypothetical protein N0V84_012062 [Fusarium piperis]|uniref:Uncharacterized protein n=1 Tax=Fusarium piperis TaxID=1435070 RepID=A0A9W8TA02_9HYPO|nr:hypothetical protein N0V84_012062 [Fusarium piperis]
MADLGHVLSPDQLNLLFLQYQLDDPDDAGALPDDEVSQRLMDKSTFLFVTYAWLIKPAWMQR